MSPFTDPVVKTLNTGEATVASDPKKHTPLLDQEEIDDEQPPRINLTAVVCTAIVAVCATIIILVARPWRGSEPQLASADPVAVAVDTTQSKPAEPKPAESKPTESRPAEPKPAESKPAEPKPAEAQPTEPKLVVTQATDGLPLLKVTPTGTSNPYNNIRLVDASTRKLTKNEVAQMTKQELALSRNAIYARHGYVYKNAELGEFFSKQKWFKPNADLKLEDVKTLFSEIEVANINLILSQERK